MLLSATQDPFWEKIQKVRNTELSILWRTFVIDATNGFLLNAIPTVVSVATFSVYVLAGNRLTAAKVSGTSAAPPSAKAARRAAPETAQWATTHAGVYAAKLRTGFGK